MFHLFSTYIILTSVLRPASAEFFQVRLWALMKVLCDLETVLEQMIKFLNVWLTPLNTF